MAHPNPSMSSIAGMESAPRAHSEAHLLWCKTKGGHPVPLSNSMPLMTWVVA